MMSTFFSLKEVSLIFLKNNSYFSFLQCLEVTQGVTLTVLVTAVAIESLLPVVEIPVYLLAVWKESVKFLL